MKRQNRNGNSFQGIAVGIFAVLFMVYWMFLAVKGGASPVTLIFGVYGLFMAVRIVISQYKAGKNNRNSNSGYNGYDMPHSSEDPWDVSYPSPTERYGTDIYGNSISGTGTQNFCPYCGIPVKQEHEFCKNCGRKLSD